MTKAVWCNAINLNGLLFSTPFKGRVHEELNGYWDTIGNDVVDELGEHDKNGRIEFASTDKAVAEAWTQGALAAISMLHRWSENPPTYDEYVKEFDGDD